MKVVIIGSGAYVTGRGGFGNGTILSSMYQYVKDGGIIDKIIITSPTSKSKLDVINAKENIESRVGMQLPVDFLELESISSLKRCFSEECVDLCIISIPDHLHSMYIKACIESGIAVLVVKPFTDNYEEALSLTEDAEKGGIYCGVEFHKRLDESNLYLKRRIKEGGLGELLYFVVNYSQRISIPTNTFRSWSSKTNIFQYLGVHYVDLVYFLTGYMPTSLSVTSHMKRLKGMGINTWDAIIVSSTWEDVQRQDCFSAHFHLNWIDPNSSSAMSDQRILCVGTKGRVDCDQKNRGVTEVTDEGNKEVNPYFSEWLQGPSGYQVLNGYGYRSIKQFLDDIRDLKRGITSVERLSSIRPSFRQSLVSMKFIDLVNEQLKSGDRRWVNLEW